MGESSFIIALILFNVILIAFVSAIVIFVRQYRLKKKAHLAEIEGIDEIHKKDLLETEIEIQAQTMKHIGREIHDNIGQKLTLASLYTQQLAFENKAPQVSKSIEQIGGIINESLEELRELSKSLTDNSIENNTLPNLIQGECKKVNDLKKCRVHFTHNLTEDIPSYATKSVCYRITQEFLQNSLKHSQCENIEVSLQLNEQVLTLLLEDDGKGFDSTRAKSKGIGLKNMKKRTDMLGGAFSVESGNGRGTKIKIVIPK